MKISVEVVKGGRTAFAHIEADSGLRANVKFERVKAKDRILALTATIGGFGEADPVKVFADAMRDLQDLVARGAHARALARAARTARRAPESATPKEAKKTRR